MNQEVEKIYKDYVGRLKNFADDADCLTDGNKSKFSNLLIKEYNKDLARIVKRETFVQKIINKLFKRKLRALKQGSAPQEQQEPTFCCSNCVNCTILDGLTYCLVHKLVFETPERERQFCLQFCRSYQENVPDDEQCVSDDSTDVSEEVVEAFMDNARGCPPQLSTAEYCLPLRCSYRLLRRRLYVRPAKL